MKKKTALSNMLESHLYTILEFVQSEIKRTHRNHYFSLAKDLRNEIMHRNMNKDDKNILKLPL
jgi:hypothetical protein